MRWWWDAELQHPRGDEEEQTREPERETRAQQPQWPAPRKNGCDCSTSLLPADGIERMVEQHCVLQHGRRCSAAACCLLLALPSASASCSSSSRRMTYVAYELVASKQPASRQPTRHISAAMSMYEHDGKRHVRYLPFIRNIRYDIRGIVFPFHAPALAGEVSKRAGP